MSCYPNCVNVHNTDWRITKNKNMITKKNLKHLKMHHERIWITCLLCIYSYIQSTPSTIAPPKEKIDAWLILVMFFDRYHFIFFTKAIQSTISIYLIHLFIFLFHCSFTASSYAFHFFPCFLTQRTNSFVSSFLSLILLYQYQLIRKNIIIKGTLKTLTCWT